MANHYLHQANRKDKQTQCFYIIQVKLLDVTIATLTGQISSLGVPRTRRTQHSCSMSFSPYEHIHTSFFTSASTSQAWPLLTHSKQWTAVQQLSKYAAHSPAKHRALERPPNNSKVYQHYIIDLFICTCSY